MSKSPPKLIIFAGANGSGKTTVARMLLPKIGIKEFVNADEIARGLSPLNPMGQAVSAGRLVLKRIYELIAKKESFAIETTLSGNTLLKYIEKAQLLGYLVEMHYIFCADINLNIQRIKNRVKQGGHHVPAPDVRRRYWRSLKNWIRYKDICDIMNLYDTTSGNVNLIAHRGDGSDFFRLYDRQLWDRFLNKVAGAFVDER